jgi:hypothetical protein
MIRLLAVLFLLGAVVGFLGSPSPALGQHAEIVPQTATLVARKIIDGYDNSTWRPSVSSMVVTDR